MRTTRCVLAVATTLVVLLPTQSRRILAQASEVIDDPEVYAVYASVLPARFSSGDTDLTRVAVLQETRSHMNCLPQFGQEWNPVVENYKQENARVRTLLPGFNLGLPYTLVAPAILSSPDAQTYARYPNGKLLSLSAVGFDETKTRALVTVQYACGFNCGGGWHILKQKDGGRWVQPKDNVPTCTWIS